MDIRCDVLVVGAGPAGLSCAIVLAKKGFSVVVVEKNRLGGPTETSYDITEGDRIKSLLATLRMKPDKVSSVSEWFSPHDHFVLKSNIQDFYFKRGPEPDSLENRLLDEAQRQHVQVFFQVPSLSFFLKKGMVQSVLLRGKQIRIVPRFVIAADGPFSIVGKKLQVKVSRIAEFIAYGVIFDSDLIGLIPHARIFFDQEIAPGGYIYSGNVRLDSFYCVVADKSQLGNLNLNDNLKKFLDRKGIDIKLVKSSFKGLGLSGYQETVVGNTLFVGAAGHLYDSFLGYGLNFALESGSTAANAVEVEKLDLYEQYTKKIAFKIKQGLEIRKIWRTMDNDFFDKLISNLNGRGTPDVKTRTVLRYFTE